MASDGPSAGVDYANFSFDDKMRIYYSMHPCPLCCPSPALPALLAAMPFAKSTHVYFAAPPCLFCRAALALSPARFDQGRCTHRQAIPLRTDAPVAVVRRVRQGGRRLFEARVLLHAQQRHLHPVRPAAPARCARLLVRIASYLLKTCTPARATGRSFLHHDCEIMLLTFVVWQIFELQ